MSKNEKEDGLFFLDSGAFSQKVKAAEYAKKKGHTRWDYFGTKDFWAYCDDYAAFVKKYNDVIDFYANVDVIGNAELTHRNQKYFETKHKLTPVPVFHLGSDLKWFKQYMEEGYELIGIGGMVGLAASKGQLLGWLDQIFTLVCDAPNHLPKVKLHGFGMTAYDAMLRYCWWSVDSASWTKVGAFGSIMVPHKRQGKFTFGEEPYIITTSNDSPSNKVQGKHFATLSGAEKAIVLEWLEQIGVPLGKNAKDGTVETYGVINRHSERKIANLLFFEGLRAWLPKYPWPFAIKKQKGFGTC